MLLETTQPFESELEKKKKKRKRMADLQLANHSAKVL